MVDKAEFRSYYGRPILKEPAWEQPDVPLYLFLGGAAGAAASMAAMADRTGYPTLTRTGRIVAAGGATASVVALIHDLGRPTRFLNMLRVFKPTSPLSVGSWILAPFSGLAAASAASDLTGRLPVAGTVAGGAAGVLGPAMCTYTAVLLADTATPAWHESYRDLPVLFAGSAVASAAGAALLVVPPRELRPVVRLGLLGSAVELAAAFRLEHAPRLVSETYRTGRAGKLLTASRALTATGAVLSLFSRRRRSVGLAAGIAFLAGGLCTRFGVYAAGVASAQDPKYVVIPQRERARDSRAHSAPVPAQD
ncbi:polysulfide reductase [Allosaccharopolyspora coralli]|uniref:Polysulfide reductase n=2 Tax=Allosaccharopolyspora coralli TaxID=2665642 RepID=A0A5Q3QC61_9PSEU|nr:polysulfide reductase [Allosaccharopolyspora coralli]